MLNPRQSTECEGCRAGWPDFRAIGKFRHQSPDGSVRCTRTVLTLREQVEAHGRPQSWPRDVPDRIKLAWTSDGEPWNAAAYGDAHAFCCWESACYRCAEIPDRRAFTEPPAFSLRGAVSP